jgi:nucleoside-diphosphate-sugar epimerase
VNTFSAHPFFRGKPVIFVPGISIDVHQDNTMFRIVCKEFFSKPRNLFPPIVNQPRQRGVSHCLDGRNSRIQGIELRVPSIKRAESILNWKPVVSMDDLLIKTMDFYFK